MSLITLPNYSPAPRLNFSTLLKEKERKGDEELLESSSKRVETFLINRFARRFGFKDSSKRKDLVRNHHERISCMRIKKKEEGKK